MREVLFPAPVPVVLDALPAHRFEGTPRPIDEMFAQIYATGSAARVSRVEALQVPAIQRARNEIAAISTLPLVLMAGPNRIRSTFLDQLDRDVANVVTMAQTLEDLLFESIAWWRVTERDWRGFPVKVRHVDVDTVSLDPPAGVVLAPLPSGEDPRDAAVWISGERVSARDVIRFDSPNPALLSAGARAIRKALLLDKTAVMYADSPRPLDVFTAAKDPTVDAPEDDDVTQFLGEWRVTRKRGGTGYVPPEFERVDVNAPSPGELQLVQLQQQASLEIANGTGIDPEDLGVSTTSRTYFNSVDRRQSKINSTYMPFILAITQRLSMPDVTPRGQRVVADLTEYLKPDPQSRIAYYQGLIALGVKKEWILEQEGIPPEAIADEADQPAAGVEGDDQPGQNSAPKLRAVFDGARPAHTFAIPTAARTFSVDQGARTVSGLALPWNTSTRRIGYTISFEPGSIEWNGARVGNVKHYRDHVTPVGKALQIEAKRDGLHAVLDVQQGPAGDDLLAAAAHGTYDGLSVGVDYDDDPDAGDVSFDEEARHMTVHHAVLREISSTAMPAYDDARITRVNASRTGGNMHCEICGGQHAPGVACAARTAPATTATFTNPVEPDQTPVGGNPPPAPPAPPMDDAAVMSRFRAFLASDHAAGIQPPPRPEFVDPTRRTGAHAQVVEAAPYRMTFENVTKGPGAGSVQMRLHRGTHDFSQDLHAWFVDGDHSARNRAIAFVRDQFDVITSNVDELNPTRQIPSRYLDQRQYRYPIWSMINKGTLPNITPFSWPKFNSASGLVAAHTEGTEPSSGSFTTTSQTVTPTGVSGKAKLSREVWDQGGNPQVSTLIWNKMVQGWFELLEAGAVTLLDAASPTALATFTAGGGTDKQTLAAEMEAGLAALQFVRGGYTFDGAMTQIDLYQALAAAKDDTGRALYPMIGPANAQGQTESRFGAINVAGTLFYPSWALAATGSVAASSYLIDSEAVDGWASNPERLTFDNTEVANVYIGIWGYRAYAINDINGVREITYDPVA